MNKGGLNKSLLFILNKTKMKTINRMFRVAYTILFGFPAFSFLGILKSEMIYFAIALAIAIPGFILFFIALHMRNMYDKEIASINESINQIGRNSLN